ncbi:glycine betaine/L-proline ABC transporter substrate-binding protein ProX [Vacuolonema iberomarrocanum]|uniref:glycine betaine/L-proline ABC transporter substrate-binding protein ProX n=1 Tax=Vacuolonema iberomarrocanum TaxID=3454632 RepID=UPI003F6DA949
MKTTFQFTTVSLRRLGVMAALGAVLTTAAACGGGTTTDATDPAAEGGEAAEALPGEGVTVTAGYALLEELFQTEIVNVGLEQLGYEIGDGKELEYATMHVDIGNGGIDYTASHWEQLHEDFYQESGGEGTMVREGVIVADVLQGYMIDTATAEEYGITSLEQLQDPEIAALFDTDGDGRANLTGCNPGWGCELVIEHQLDEYGLRDTVQHEQGQYFALIADTITRFNQGEPILYYTWTPLWVSGVLTTGEDVQWLNVPYTSLPEAQGEVAEEDTTVDGTNLGFALDQILIVSNREFAEANPAAATFFDLVQIPINDVSAQNQLIQDGEDSPEDVRRHAEEWIAENQEQFDSWIQEAMEAGMQASS